MDHPNIAKVFDGGATAAGRPYFVMELVKGIPITEYCDQEKLTTRERLALFVSLCHGVQHAHQKGVIHRDLKPSNVLVEVHDVSPVPKIIDFGVAKAMRPQLTEQSLHTGLSQMVGTPTVHEPRAGRSKQPGRRYPQRHLFAGGAALRTARRATRRLKGKRCTRPVLDELRRIIREVDPPRPSVRVSTLQAADLSTISERRQVEPRKLSKHLSGDLDWIVMKALEKDRTRRYATAMALAEDVEHYLAHEPVQAGPPGNWYRFRKYARRFRVPLSIAAGFVALFVVITMLAVGGYYREAKLRSDTEIARHQAENENEKAKDNFKMARDAVKKYYTQVASDPRLKPHNLEKLRRDLLESANEFYEKLISQEAGDRDLQHESVNAYIARGRYRNGSR